MKLKAINYSLLLALFCINFLTAQIERIEPPNWWVGMENDTVQLLVYGNDIAEFTPSILNCQGCAYLVNYHRGDNSNYLFLDLLIPDYAMPQSFPIIFGNTDTGKSFSYPYELKRRAQKPEDFKGFDSSDVIYLITPDRFANGNPDNDIIDGLLETDLDRNHNYKRHGGDIQGIIDHLDYIDDMGFTAIWSSPLLRNNMPEQSYHGYAMTDFYQVDPRFGTLEEYIKLSDGATQKGIKLIMDQVANHCGLQHWWMKDLPF
ncbi:MAG: alpha-amylase family glycosyl hydrolase, partial [Maribacter sp.]